MPTPKRGQGIIAYPLMDNALSADSKNPVKNRVLTSEINPVKDLLKDQAPAIVNTVSGGVATFNDGVGGMPANDIIIQIDPVQTGSGDPSPGNRRLITGWTGVTISHSGADTSNPETTTISWESEVGTVYGGSFNVTTGVLTVDRVMVSPASVVDLAPPVGLCEFDFEIVDYDEKSLTGVDNNPMISDMFKYENTLNDYIFMPIFSYFMAIVLPENDAEQTADGFNRWLAEHKPKFVVELFTPQTYQLDPHQIEILAGENSFWANTGNISVSYTAETKQYVGNAIADALAEL